LSVEEALRAATECSDLRTNTRVANTMLLQCRQRERTDYVGGALIGVVHDPLNGFLQHRVSLVCRTVVTRAQLVQGMPARVVEVLLAICTGRFGRAAGITLTSLAIGRLASYIAKCFRPSARSLGAHSTFLPMMRSPALLPFERVARRNREFSSQDAQSGPRRARALLVACRSIGS